MKKNILSAVILAATLTIAACGPGATGTTASTPASNTAGTDIASAGASILGNLLGSILSNTLTEQSFVGTWTYQSPQVRFESENLLAQAGGTVVASTIEQKLDGYLAKIGITKGVTSFTFKEDKTFLIATNGKNVASGTYTYDRSNKILNLTSTLGLMNQNCIVGMDGTNLCLLYDADKLLTVMNTVGATLGKTNSTLGSISSILGQNYTGMKVGFSLSK